MKLYDCFLFNDEIELLEIRLKLLGDVVDYFVIVQSAQTFTGKSSKLNFPTSGELIECYRDKIRLITLESLDGDDAWARESFSRNAMSQGLTDAGDTDLIMISDVDELSRPEVLARVKRDGVNSPVTLVLDYFNFKFNYKLMVGLDTYWAGPVLAQASKFAGAQAARDSRWKNMDRQGGCIFDAGWHFSYITATGDISIKLASFSHQEAVIQSRKDRVADLIRSRQGFHDHIVPGSVWAVIPLGDLRCESLCRLIETFPELVCHDATDPEKEVDSRMRDVVRRITYRERDKLLSFYPWRELARELLKRFFKRMFGRGR